MNRRAFLFSAAAAPIAAALPLPPLVSEQARVNLGMVMPGSYVYAPHRLMWIDGNHTIHWTAISDAEMWA